MTWSPSTRLPVNSSADRAAILTVGTGDPGDVPAETVLELLRTAYRAGLPVGVDTEFDHDMDFTPRGRSALHLASLGILSAPGAPAARPAGPAGEAVARSVVLGAPALPLFARWFRSSHRKVLYSASIDLHTLANAGIEVNNWLDILPFSRYLRPDGDDHGLKWHIQHTLGLPGLGSYRENFRRPKIGVKGQPLKTWEVIPIAEIVPGHPLWDLMVRYAALDAEATVKLWARWHREYGL